MPSLSDFEILFVHLFIHPSIHSEGSSEVLVCAGLWAKCQDMEVTEQTQSLLQGGDTPKGADNKVESL